MKTKDYIILLIIYGGALFLGGVQLGMMNAAVNSKSVGKEIIDLKKQYEVATFEAGLYKKAVRIIVCESNGIHFRQGKQGEYGLAQFKRETFDEFKQQMSKPKLQWRNKWDQLEVLLWALANGKENHWSCRK